MILLLTVVTFFQGLVLWAQHYLAREETTAC